MTLPPRRADARRNRESLLHAARHVFAESGLDAGLDSIARAAGVGNATLYRHFPTRDELIAAVLHEDLRQSLLIMQQGQDAGTAWDRFEHWFSETLMQQRHDRGLSERLLSVRRGLDAAVDALRDATVAAIGDLVTNAKLEGTFRPDRNQEDVLLLLYAHEHFARLRLPAGEAISRRWAVLAIATLKVEPPGAVMDPDDATQIHRAFQHRLRGEDRSPGDL